MPSPKRPARAAIASALAGALLAGCAGARTEPTPVAALASSPQAAAAFEAIREAWRDHDPPAALRVMLERFLAQFPQDGLVPLARVTLALAALKEQDFRTADAQLAMTAGLPLGTVHDLWTIAQARRLRLRADPETAMRLLRPLVGKNVDPLARAVFEEELTLTALATHREYEAISYMDVWLRASADEDKEATVKTVTAIVQRLPKEVLVGALQAMRKERAKFGYGADIERILAARLVEIATTTGDAELARMLLDPAAGAIVATGEAGAQLVELATSRRGLNVVEGRTIGLLLPTESPALRDESADVLRGVMWALGLPRGVRGASSAGATATGAGTERPPGNPIAGAGAEHAPSPESCGALEPAPDLDEPRPNEAVRLVTRNDAGSLDRTEVSLDELAGEGAAVIIAGLDAQTVGRALRWGENHTVPVIALVSPNSNEAQGSFGFLLGERRTAIEQVLIRAVPSLTSGPVAPIVDASEVSLHSPQGGRSGDLTLTPPVSCDIPAARAGEPRFPISQWEHDKTHAWLVSGSPDCATDLVGELSATRARGVVALMLEAAALPPHAASLRVVSAAAGVVPASAASDARNDELQRFTATLGRVGWWTALGRDAATLARLAVRELPLDTAADARSVTGRRAKARDLLGRARARLWTTEASGWDMDHALKRTICTIDAH